MTFLTEGEMTGKREEISRDVETLRHSWGEGAFNTHEI